MHAQERESYIRSAVDASPHKVAVIFVKDHYANGSGHIAVAWKDANDNLVFARMAPGAQFSGDLPKDTFGNPALSGPTLKALSSNYQTVEAFPLDLIAKASATNPTFSPEKIIDTANGWAKTFIETVGKAHGAIPNKVFGYDLPYKTLSTDIDSYAVRQALISLGISKEFQFGKDEKITNFGEGLQHVLDFLKIAPTGAETLARFLLDGHGGMLIRTGSKPTQKQLMLRGSLG